MVKQETELLFAVDWSSFIPTEVRLFRFGITDTVKGEFLFDEQSAEDVLGMFSDSGMDSLPFDVAHGMVNPNAPPDSHKALGWFVPVVKDDVDGGGGMALFATDIQWTEAGAAALQAREFRYFSPAITYDPDTRRITGLINCALTNLPATKGQEPLVLDGATHEENEQEPNMKALLSAFGVEDEASAVAALSALRAASNDKDQEIETLSASIKAKDDDLIKLNAEVVELHAAKEQDAKDAKIAELSAAGKLPPAQAEFAKGLSLEQLGQFAETLSASTIATGVVTEPDSGKVETLSADEKQACALLGVTEDDYLKNKESK